MVRSILLLQITSFAALFVIGLAVAYVARRPLHLVVRWGVRLARHPQLAILTTGCVAGLVTVTIASLRPPTPQVHDEFSYLLAADTFASGRVTNPPHPMWKHFETIGVLQQPTYASKYPPGQGLVLALGKVVGGNPWVGVLISAAFAAGAVCWMLQGWVPGRWALVGGLVIALHPLVQVHWSQSYWGGNLALVGGAILLGAYYRLIHSARVRDAFLMAVGLAILANTRPFEGFMVSIPVAVAMFFWLFSKSRSSLSTVALRVVLPLCVSLVVVATAMGYYNARITNDPWKMPYTVYEETYSAAPVLVWQSLRPIPEYRHRVIRDFYLGCVLETYENQRDLASLWTVKGNQLVYIWHVLLGIPLTIPVVAFFRSRVGRSVWLPIACILMCGAALAAGVWTNSHYFAPAVGAVILLVVQGMRRLRIAMRRAKSIGPLLLPTIMIAQVLCFLVSACGYVVEHSADWARARVRIVTELGDLTGQHLVFVKYSTSHSPHDEWIYNEADIDSSQVVWARCMGTAADKRLLEYFERRRAWLLLADEEPPRLSDYRSAGRMFEEQ